MAAGSAAPSQRRVRSACPPAVVAPQWCQPAGDTGRRSWCRALSGTHPGAMMRGDVAVPRTAACWRAARALGRRAGVTWGEMNRKIVRWKARSLASTGAYTCNRKAITVPVSVQVSCSRVGRWSGSSHACERGSAGGGRSPPGGAAPCLRAGAWSAMSLTQTSGAHRPAPHFAGKPVAPQVRGVLGLLHIPQHHLRRTAVRRIDGHAPPTQTGRRQPPPPALSALQRWLRTSSSSSCSDSDSGSCWCGDIGDLLQARLLSSGMRRPVHAKSAERCGCRPLGRGMRRRWTARASQCVLRTRHPLNAVTPTTRQTCSRSPLAPRPLSWRGDPI